ncbi:hypothetical protein D8674_012375 [Pyrus ussuriensis x Pyrus communis]|uniref:Uncharacterized protein n=1 Tax=Pyrus ussuriensis x Pyrus communis TaxID=2448454 RepID=A0A5N5G249_9ROSA|nr:hypothetical protein D8674_012375 [Pyrus ussuriensis x Pyrus communis]
MGNGGVFKKIGKSWSKLEKRLNDGVSKSKVAGIGLFIAFLGLQIHQGVGLVGPDPSTLVTITACSNTNPATVFPNTQIGDTDFHYFKKVVDFHKIQSTAGAISFTNFNRSEVWVALVTLLYVDVLATTGTLYTMAEMGGFVNDEGGFEGPSLVVVGVMMMKVVKDINWGKMKEAAPAFMTMVLMPLTYSIANGIIGGIGLYIALNLYDYLVIMIKWLIKMKTMVGREQNQVSATAPADSAIEVI